MLGYAYEVPEYFRGPGFSKRTNESVQLNRPIVIEQLRRINETNRSIADRKCIIYVAVNKVNNKLYVGKTERGIKKRSNEHLRSTQGLFARAIKKYGKEAFEFLVFSALLDNKRLNYCEQSLIGAILPEYNLTAGGEGMSGHRPSEETRKRLVESHTGKVGHWAGKTMPRSLIEKRTATRRERDGYVGPRKGIPRTPETIEKLKKAAAGKQFPAMSEDALKRKREAVIKRNLENRKPVLCIEDNKVFDSIKSAAAHYGASYSQLGRVLHGKGHHACGKKFRFVDGN